MRIKQGDQVVVTSGDDAGSQPRKVLEVLQGGRKVLVEGVNRVYKHVKRGHPKSPQGGRLSIEKPIDISKVQYFCPACSKGVRLGYRYTPEGRKERFCRKCDASAGVTSPARKAYAATK
ncbi:50S ribosomal protein L24 [bacterium]|nr:50S ribosomal protein L24 [bacterium]